MPEPLNKQQLIDLVPKLIRATEQQVTEWTPLIEASVPCPVGEFFGYIFWSNTHGLGNNPTGEEIVEKALSYKPIQL